MIKGAKRWEVGKGFQSEDILGLAICHMDYRAHYIVYAKILSYYGSLSPVVV